MKGRDRWHTVVVVQYIFAETITKLGQVVCVCEGSARGLGVINCTTSDRGRGDDTRGPAVENRSFMTTKQLCKAVMLVSGN